MLHQNADKRMALSLCKLYEYEAFNILYYNTSNSKGEICADFLNELHSCEVTNYWLRKTFFGKNYTKMFFDHAEMPQRLLTCCLEIYLW